MAPLLELPYDIQDVSAEEDKIIKKCLLGYMKPFVKCGKNGYIMPGAFRKHAEAIYNFQVRPDDVWVISYPRSGTTWTQEMVWLIENDLDFKTAQEKPLFDRFPMLELTSQIPEIGFQLIKSNFMNIGNFQGLNQAARSPSWKNLEEITTPRFIKTHMPLSMLPPSLLDTAKVIYVARDPRDTLVSYYFLHKMIFRSFMRFTCKHYWDAFKRDLLPYSPIIQHVNESWEQRHHKNLHIIFYEDMIADLPKVIRGVSKFLNRDLTDKQVDKLANHLNFDKLQKNKTVNNTTKNSEVQFIRKGKVEGWREHFDEKMELEAEEFLTTSLKGLDLKYPSFSLYECSYL
ncbi:unnamed protein product [Euphydryas editha]|uniref:Sulfotransferase domain-containing protein n=1 Tax=Euphydryas editha TaxID=104508 RepID=A0AAU9V3Z2_EUPED|nr:unnamed protein product [Euphydryas editha]